MNVSLPFIFQAKKSLIRSHRYRSLSTIFFALKTTKMDRLLCPKQFQTEPSDANAAKLYKHWKTTLENYLDCTITRPAATPEDPDATAAAEAEVQKKKRYG